jgi:hypothetical protein
MKPPQELNDEQIIQAIEDCKMALEGIALNNLDSEQRSVRLYLLDLRKECGRRQLTEKFDHADQGELLGSTLTPGKQAAAFWFSQMRSAANGNGRFS